MANPNRETVAASIPDDVKVVKYPNGDLRISIKSGRYTVELVKFDNNGGNIMLRHDTRANKRSETFIVIPKASEGEEEK